MPGGRSCWMVSRTQDDVGRIRNRHAASLTSTPGTAGRRKRKVSRTLKGWAFLVPTFVFIGAFAYYPAVRALEGAFTTWDGVSPPAWVGLRNFRQLWHDSVFLGSFLHLLLWSIIGIPVGMGASLLVAILIYRLHSKRAQYWFRAGVLSHPVPARDRRHSHLGQLLRSWRSDRHHPEPHRAGRLRDRVAVQPPYRPGRAHLSGVPMGGRLRHAGLLRRPAADTHRDS